MNRRDAVDGLDLHHHQVLNAKVHPISKFDLYPSICNRKSNLRESVESSLFQFVSHAGRVSAFQQTRAKLGVNRHSSSYDSMADLLRVFALIGTVTMADLQPSMAVNDIPCCPGHMSQGQRKISKPRRTQRSTKGIPQQNAFLGLTGACSERNRRVSLGVKEFQKCRPLPSP